MIRLVRFVALGLALTTPFALSAKAVEEKDVLSGRAKLDPAKGYILSSGTERQFGVFLHVPDQETRAKYEADRQKAFAKAQRRYASDLEAWNAAVQNKQPGIQPGERPEEPRLESFAIDPIELRDSESFGPFYVYSKGQTVSYLNEVKPGTWIWYGPLFMGANGAATGTCYCLGTVRFEVKAGVITDLGTSLQSAPRWDDEMDVARLKLKELNGKRVAAGKEPLKTLGHREVTYGVPASLQGWPSVRGELQASPKMNNYFGALVSRVAPIPGILSYHRDTVVDGRTGEEIASPTIVSRAKIKS